MFSQTFIPIKPRVRRKQRGPARAAPTPATVSVYQVYVENETVLAWEFTSNILSFTESCPQLQADDGRGGGMRVPAVLGTIGDDTLLAEYAGADFTASCAWQVLAPPEGLVFADGTLIVPESGNAE